MRRLVLGDIHGRKDYLIEVLQECDFDFENDLLIQIGDIVDRGPEPMECIAIINEVQNKILIRGNHDQAFVHKVLSGTSYMGDHPSNGQQVTLDAYDKLIKEEKEDVLNFFKSQQDYHITKDDILFVHGGIPLDEDIDQVDPNMLHWDRDMINEAIRATQSGKKLTFTRDYKKIYIGHTPTLYYNMITPMFMGNIINVDTGCGKGGPLTIMDIDSGQYWQSKHELKIKTNGIDSEAQETETEEVREGSLETEEKEG